MRNFFIALQFLTIFSIRKEKNISDKDFARSTVYFPLVGAIIGAGLSLLYVVTYHFLPRPVVCSLLIIASIILTGGLHLDGFVDTIDGLTGGKDKYQILKIMRDEHIGAFGTIGLIALLLLKWTLLYSIPNQLMISALILTLALSRWSMVILCRFFPYARDEVGLGKPFASFTGTKEVIWATTIAILLSIALASLRTIILLPLVLIVSIAFGLILNKKIGGITGDTIGALNEMVETLGLFIFL
jgi:adenosylcobinamide-GDP ribazoletransferase